jgi:hypothetical protein
MSEQSMTLIEWLYERLDNCNRLAKEKRGADKAGWIEDASYFEAAIDMASDAATLRGYIRTYGETPTMTAASRDRWKQRAEQSDLALAEARREGLREALKIAENYEDVEDRSDGTVQGNLAMTICTELRDLLERK